MIERLREFDEIISWYGENRPEFRELVAELKLPFQFRRALPDGACHAVDFYAGQTPHGNPRIYCPDLPRTFAVIHPFASSKAWSFQWARIAFFMTALVASLDEWHQTFLPSRTGRWQDVALDSSAALTMQVFLWIVLRRRSAARTA